MVGGVQEGRGGVRPGQAGTTCVGGVRVLSLENSRCLLYTEVKVIFFSA